MKKVNIIASILIILGIFMTAFGQDKGNEISADRMLRGSGRVNASTLGMEFELPLGSYPGRGINIPINLSYSSKLWRLEYTGNNPDPGGNSSPCYKHYTAKYSEDSAAGWTTSLATPYIEYVGAENFYNSDGTPVSYDDIDCPTTGDGNGSIPYFYIRRIIVHLPSGETHEMRPDDTPISFTSSGVSDPYGPYQPSMWNATFYAADGSNIKYLQNSTNNTYRLLMADGSFYDFDAAVPHGSDRKAVKFTDRNGNYTTYHAPDPDYPNGYWIDTLGRIIGVPLGLQAPSSPTTAQQPQIYQMPGMTGTYKIQWKRLNGGTQAESALTDINGSAYQLKYVGDTYVCQGTLGQPRYCTYPAGSSLFTGGDAARMMAQSLFNPVVLTEIELPTGQKYKFSYDIYARIEKIVYPTGGEEKFQYSVVPTLSMLDPTDSVGGQSNFGVTNRKVYKFSGDIAPYEWTYSASYQNPQGYKITLDNPDGIKIERYLHRGLDAGNGAGQFGYDEALAGMAYKEEVFDNSNPRHLVTRKLTTWTKTVLNASGGGSYPIHWWHPRVTGEETQIFDTTGNGVSATTVFEYEGDLSYRDTPVLMKKASQYALVAVGSSQPSAPVLTSETAFLIYDENYPQWIKDIYKSQNMISLATSTVIRGGGGTIVSRSETRYDDGGYSPNIGRGNPTTLRVWDSTKGNWDNPNAYLSTRAKFDTYGNQYEMIDARGISTFIEFDSVYHTFPVRVVSAVPDPTGTNGSNTAFETTTTFDWVSGLPLTANDANGLETRITYDPVTLRTLNTKTFYQNTQVGGMSETVYHDEPNNYRIKSRTQIDSDKWAESITYFDGLGRAYKAEEINSEGSIFVEKEFDAEGRVKRVTNPFRVGEIKHWTTNVYDESSRIKEVILPDGARVRTDYGVLISDIVGVTKTITDQAGKKRRGISDALGRMIRVIEDPGGQNLLTDYVFDTLGNLRKTIQGEQNRYFTYDSLGRLLYAKQPEQEANAAFVYTDSITNNSQWSVKYEYDDNGNIIRTTDANDTSVQGIYDNFNRLIVRDYSDTTPDVQFFYDGRGLDTAPAFSKGKTTRIASSVSETEYTSFDVLGRLLTNRQITGGQTYNFSYQYNLTALVAETYPSGRTVSYEFDQDGDLSRVAGQIANGAKTYANSFRYNSSGAIESMRLGNGKWETAKYNERLQITQIGLGNSAADASLLNLEYGYGNNQQNNGSLRTQKISFNGLAQPFEQIYQYDDLNRLLSAEEKVNNQTTWRQSFTYDRYGNRRFDANQTTTLAQSNNITNPQIDASTNRFSSGQNYLYDKNGSLTRDAEGRQFLYDAESHQREVRDANNQVFAVYHYDGEGRRVKKVLLNSQEETIFVYNARGKLAAEYVINPQTQAETPSTRYLTNDHLGSPRVITNQLGNVINRKDFMAFGEEISTAQRITDHGYASTPDDAIRQGYTGYEKDDESGLDFAQARYYSSIHGRFTSVDPLTASANLKNPQTFNRYSYVLNSPYKFTDPLGLIARTCCDDEIRSAIREEIDGTWIAPDGTRVNLTKADVEKIVEIIFPEAKQQFELRKAAQMALNAKANSGGVSENATVNTTTATNPSTVTLSTSEEVEIESSGKVKVGATGAEGEFGVGSKNKQGKSTSITKTTAPGVSKSISEPPGGPEQLNSKAETNGGKAVERLAEKLDNLPVTAAIEMKPRPNGIGAVLTGMNRSYVLTDTAPTLRAIFNKVDNIAINRANVILPEKTKKQE